jgi:methylase of polypeptide subunit release factors
MHDVIRSTASSYSLGRRPAAHSRWRRRLRAAIHFFSYHLILNRHTTRATRAAGFRLSVGPTVFHPRYFLTSEFFASVIDRLDLKGKRVADVGTGSGILALAAVRAGAESVAAIDINPNAVLTTAENARANRFENSIYAVCSDLFAAVAPSQLFDVIISSPPSFPGEPRDIADRAWHAGANYCDIAQLFEQARERLAEDGCVYILLSSDSDLDLFGALIAQAGFAARLVAERSVVIETLLIYELQPV